MRLIVLLMILPLSISAQWFRISKEMPLRFGLDYMHSFPVGGMKAGNNKSFVYGQAKTGYGAGFLISMPVRNKLYASISIKHTDFVLDEEVVKQQLYDYFDDDNHYTHARALRNTYVNYIGMEFSYLFHVGKFEVLPSLGGGLFVFEAPLGHSVSVNRKLQNSNYSEEVSINPEMNISMYFGGGVRAYRKLFWVVDLSMALNYLPAKTKVKTDVEVTDYYSNRYKKGSFTSDLTVTAIQLEAGLRIRAWRSKRDATE